MCPVGMKTRCLWRSLQHRGEIKGSIDEDEDGVVGRTLEIEEFTMFWIIVINWTIGVP